MGKVKRFPHGKRRSAKAESTSACCPFERHSVGFASKKVGVNVLQALTVEVEAVG
jgi:hypothetical protein